MEYEFVSEPSLDNKTADAIRRERDLKLVESSLGGLLRNSEKEELNKFLTAEEIDLIEQHRQRMEEFKKKHHFFEEPITDVHRINYIVGHRGGDEFPGFIGSVNYERLASEVLSKLRAGTYVRASGSPYHLAEFEENVKVNYKDKIRSGWVRNT